MKRRRSLAPGPSFGGSAFRKQRKPTKLRRRPAALLADLGLELKFLDCLWDVVTVANSVDATGLEMQPSTGCTGCISCPAQGDGESQRDGRNFIMKSVWASGLIDTEAAANQADTVVNAGYYFALVLDKQANGVTVFSEDVFVNPGSNGANMLPKPLRNLQNASRFQILASQYVHPGGAYASTDGTNTASLSEQNGKTFSLSWRGNIKVNTMGTAANITSVSDNAIHLIALSGKNTFTPTIRAKVRMRFMG